MCLAIYKPADTAADWTAYENGHLQNNDSWGFAAVVDGQIVTRCGIGNFAEFRESFEPYADKQAIIHFRWATHGRKDESNCHPFMVSDALAVIHNGVIRIKCSEAAMSDTWHFNELVLKPMHERDPDFYSRPDVVFSQELAHESSKFVFLRADGDYHIWNADEGEWERDGHWYSNDSYEGYATRSSSRAATSEKGSMGFDASIRSDAPTARYDDEEETLWRREAEAVGLSAGYYGEEEEDETDHYTKIRIDDLRSYGMSESAIEEVLKIFGACGLEALHDAY
jgi:glutamine amidotransferase